MRVITSVAIGLTALVLPASAVAQGSNQVQQGAADLRAVEDGQRQCSDLDDSDFEAVGEYVMERMLGSSQSHEGMDRMMSSMMGEDGLDQMHRFMGRRFTQCGGSAPGGFGGMMGMMGGGMGMGGSADSGGSGPGMMGGDGDESGAFGSGMMGRSADDDDDDDWSGGAAALMGVLMLVLIGGLLWLILGANRRTTPGSGSDARSILDRRLASGEIDPDEYERRSAALRGTG